MKKIASIVLLSLWAITRISAQDVIEIVYSGTGAYVNVPGSITDVVSTVKGADVTITSNTTSKEYTYQVKGTSTDGSLTINGDYKLTLQLAGVSLTNAHGGAAIHVECGKRIAVELVDGTTNTLSDAALGSQKAALYFRGHVEFKGGGTLNVTGNLKHAISAKEYIELKSSTGIINVLGAVGDGIHCGKGKVNNEYNYFKMKGGIVNIINVNGDGIDSDDYGVILIDGGAISLNIGEDASGLKADSTVTIKDGEVNISVAGNDSKGIRANHTVNLLGGKTTIIAEGNGTKGIKAKRDENNATVLNGGYLNIGGGELSVQCAGGNLPSESGTTKCVAVSVDADLQQTAGDVTITAIGSEALACTVNGSETHKGGTFNIRQVPWSIKTNECQYDMSVYVAIKADDAMLTDYSGIIVGAFIDDVCKGYSVFSEPGYGIIRVKSNDTSAKAITFKIYNYELGDEIIPAVSKAVTFQSDAVEGTPGNPIVLSYNSPLLGDANNDNKVDAADIVEIANAMVGKSSSTYKEKLADVNHDNVVNIADIIQIVNIIMANK
jgi:hypothetical protein